MIQFYKMQDLPKVAIDLNGNKEDFSVSVLVYDENDPNFCEIGYYNFDTETWSHFGVISMKLICWCYIPNAKDFIKLNNLKSVIHDGYRE